MKSRIRGLSLLGIVFRPRALGLAASVLTMIVCSWWWLTAEPRHAGASLSQWLNRYPYDPIAASNAVVQIGPKAIPVLVRMVESRQPTGVLSSALKRCGLDIANSAYARRQRLLAVTGFEILGERSASAIPSLGQLVADSECGPEVAQALRLIGEAALPTIHESLSSTNDAVKRNAVRALRGSTSPQDAEELFRFSTNVDPVIRSEVFLCLPGHVSFLQDGVSKTILRGCDDPNPFVQSRAVIALRLIGDLGTNGLPKLYQMTNSTNGLLSAEVALSIKNLEKRMRLKRNPG